MSAMTRLIVRRTLAIPVALLVLTIIAFGLVSLIPGDPAALIVGDFATPEQVAEVRASLGLDEPFIQRYLDYIAGVAQGDLGTSFHTNDSVLHEILTRLPNTLVLIVPGLLLAALLGSMIGIAGAYFRRRWPDKGVSGVITTTQSVPDFFIGLLLILFFYSIWRIAPAPIGMLDAGEELPPEVTGSTSVDAVLTGSWGTVLSILEHSILPVLTIAIGVLAYFAKTVRTAMSQSMSSPQIEFARACGLPERKVIGYALIAARTSILTYCAIIFGSLVGASAIIETVFAWPGVGAWAVQGILQVDVPVIQGFILMIGVLTMVVYLALDVVVMALDPRVRSD